MPGMLQDSLVPLNAFMIIDCTEAGSMQRIKKVLTVQQGWH